MLTPCCWIETKDGIYYQNESDEKKIKLILAMWKERIGTIYLTAVSRASYILMEEFGEQKESKHRDARKTVVTREHRVDKGISF